jgi:hypothetical protein
MGTVLRTPPSRPPRRQTGWPRHRGWSPPGPEGTSQLSPAPSLFVVPRDRRPRKEDSYEVRAARLRPEVSRGTFRCRTAALTRTLGVPRWRAVRERCSVEVARARDRDGRSGEVLRRAEGPEGDRSARSHWQRLRDARTERSGEDDDRPDPRHAVTTGRGRGPRRGVRRPARPRSRSTSDQPHRPVRLDRRCADR